MFYPNKKTRLRQAEFQLRGAQFVKIEKEGFIIFCV